MPAGIDNPALGYAAFTAVKFIGYTAAAFYINAQFKTNGSPYKVGAVRLLIGMIFGVGVWAATFGLATLGVSAGDGLFVAAYVLLLLPVRLLEWHLLFSLFYREPYRSRTKLPWLLAGSAWSYILDMPAALGGFATAGFWVC